MIRLTDFHPQNASTINEFCYFSIYKKSNLSCINDKLRSPYTLLWPDIFHKSMMPYYRQVFVE